MSAEMPYWPNVELRKIANGWIVQQGQDHSRTYTMLDQVYCFIEWGECERFMAQVTEPRRQPVSAGGSPDAGR
jgi:hypothetical protein